MAIPIGGLVKDILDIFHEREHDECLPVGCSLFTPVIS